MKRIVFTISLFLSFLGVYGQNFYWDESIFCGTGILPISDMPTRIRQLLLDEEGRVTCVGLKTGDTDQGCYLERRLPNGRLDKSFGMNGRTFVSLAISGSYGDGWATVRPDGKILMNVNFQSVATPTQQAVVLCFNTNGLLDQTFGDDGTIELDFGGFSIPVFTTPSDDYFLRVKSSTPQLIFKHKNDGALDDNFGEGGQVSFPNFTFRKYGTILSMEDGSLLCGGSGLRVMGDNPAVVEFGIMKLNADGTLCSDFGENGAASFDFAEDPVYVTDYASYDCCMHLIELEDGSIVASGTVAGRTHNVLLRLHANGTLDTEFGDNGSVLYEYCEQHDMQIDTKNGDIIICGTPGDPFQTTEYSYFITRFDKDGAILFFEGVTKRAESMPGCMALRPDGRIWLGGSMDGNAVLGRITFDDNFGPAEDDCIGIDKPAVENMNVYARENVIVVTGIARDEVITVYNAAGMLVATVVADEKETVIPVSDKGVYIVRTSGKTTKIVL